MTGDALPYHRRQDFHLLRDQAAQPIGSFLLDHRALGSLRVPTTLWEHILVSLFLRRSAHHEAFNIHRYSSKEMVQDAFIVLMPAILTIGILWFFWNELVPVP